MKHTLLLGSKSFSRKKLLQDSKIPFSIVDQDADEAVCDWALPLQKIVESIALQKMAHVIMPRGTEGQIAFVLTADTLSQDLDGTINGKPVDRLDAIEKIKRARQGSRLSTAFCIERKIYKNNAWHTDKRIVQCVDAAYIFAIPDDWIDRYLENSIALNCANAIAIEEYGMQFLKMVDGSYSSIVGLPLFEVREALGELGFFE